MTIKRRLTQQLTAALVDFPCVYVNGPRQAGKTTLAQMVWGEAPYVNFDDPVMITAAKQAPDSFLETYPGKLILDEIQLVPELYRSLKASIDRQRKSHQGRLTEKYLLTGSTNILALPRLSDALVGRMVVKTLYPFSALEVARACDNSTALSNTSFLERLRDGAIASAAIDNTFSLVEMMQHATFPEVRQLNENSRLLWFRSYVATLVSRDVRSIMDIEKANLLPQLLNLLASRVGGLLNDVDLARSVQENAVTVKRYRTLLDLLFLTVSVPPWFRNVGKRLVKAPKIYLIDTNLVTYLLGRSLQSIMASDLTLFGHLVENFVATELLKQLSESASPAGLFHFRTGQGKEVDFVVEFADHTLLGIEVKTADSVSLRDCVGLIELQALAGNDFVRGCVLYRGRHVVKLADKIWAVPLAALWS